MRSFKIILILLLTCFIFLSVTSLSHATTGITFAWGMQTVPDLAGFKLFQREGETGAYNFEAPIATIEDATAREYTLQNVPDGKNYYWVLRAYDNDGLTSDSSNEVNQNQTGAPPVPGSFRIKSIIQIENIEVNQ
ncbi:MAG: hypothetical protein ACFFDY_01480 [Candidatus Thorarchaeota archaeon]